MMAEQYIKSSTPLQNDSYKKMMDVLRKTTPAQVTDQQRTALILKANKIFNEGDIEKARIIFSAIQYYDGMVRVARKYYQSGNILEAYAVFYQAGATKESEQLSKEIAQGISHLLNT